MTELKAAEQELIDAARDLPVTAGFERQRLLDAALEYARLKTTDLERIEYVLRKANIPFKTECYDNTTHGKERYTITVETHEGIFIFWFDGNLYHMSFS